MLAQECHIVAGMGISDGETDFARVFREMGIPDQWILAATIQGNPGAPSSYSAVGDRASSSGVGFQPNRSVRNVDGEVSASNSAQSRL